MRTVYTAIFGNYDDLKDVAFKTNDWRYVCYTDQDIKSNLWEVIKVPVMDCGPAKTARWYKINFHKHIETDESLWIDGTFFINCNLDRWWRRGNGSPLTTIKHPFDDCIYTDVVSCLKGKKDDRMTLIRQAAYYDNLGIPENNGLISSGILMRTKEDKTIELCETWWEQVERWSCRDQIAFGYAQWKHPGVNNSIEWDYTKADEFIHCPHLNRPYREELKREIQQRIRKHERNKTH